MTRPVLGSILASVVLAVAIVGCNAILDNEPGTLGETSEAGALPVTPASPGKDATAGDDAGAPATEDGDPPSGACPAGQQRCSGACVSLDDPRFGCGAPKCSPCPSAHGTMGCRAGACVVAACERGYADCNAKASDGCETDLSKKTSCGACNAVCGAAAPLCVAAGGTFECTNGCTPTAPLSCGSQCVDPLSNTSHCGGCNVKCPEVASATTTCIAGLCAFTCTAPTHACAGKCVGKTDPTACGPDCTACPVPPGGTATCVADACGVTCNAPNRLCGGTCTAPTDPTACGAACTVCPAPPNATATCAADACGFACKAGFGNCDQNAANGCETTFATDPLNCGACGKACAGQACVDGVCQAGGPPPGP